MKLAVLVVFFVSIFSSQLFAIRHVGNGGGLAEYLLVKSLKGSSDRWYNNSKFLSCLSNDHSKILLDISTLEKKSPSQLFFLETTEFKAKASTAELKASRNYPFFLAGNQLDEIYVDHQASLKWTDDLIIQDILIESALIRSNINLSEQKLIRQCIRQSQKSYITLDLRTYRQPDVGLIIKSDGQVYLFEYDVAKFITNSNFQCNSYFAGLQIKTKSLSGNNNLLSWVVSIQAPQGCQISQGESILKFDFEITNGTYNDFLSAQKYLELKFNKFHLIK